MSTQEQMGLALAKQGENIWMTCPFCGLATYGDPCASRLVCNMCAAEVRDGKVVSTGKGRSAALRNRHDKPSMAEELIRPPKQAVRRKTDTIKQAYGENAVLHRELVIGGEHRYVID